MGVAPSQPPPAIEARCPGLAKCAPNRHANRAVVPGVVRGWARRRHVSQRDMSAVFELCKTTVDNTLGGKNPFPTEAILNLPDDDALEVLEGLCDCVRARRARRLAHG